MSGRRSVCIRLLKCLYKLCNNHFFAHSDIRLFDLTTKISKKTQYDIIWEQRTKFYN